MNEMEGLEGRIRERARTEFAKGVRAAFEAVRNVSGATATAVKGIKATNGADVTDRVLLEKLQQHIIDRDSVRHEEAAIEKFLENVGTDLPE